MSNDWLVCPTGVSSTEGVLDERIRMLNNCVYHGVFVDRQTLIDIVREGVRERERGLHANNPNYGKFLLLAREAARLHGFTLIEPSHERVFHPPTWRDWMPHDWKRFTAMVRRFLTRLNGLYVD